MYRELTRRRAAYPPRRPDGAAAAGSEATSDRPMSFGAAVAQIIVADVSMSVDNVLAVAGAAKGEPLVLAVGLGVAIVLMAIAANAIAGLLARFTWIAWIGWLVILYVALDMIFDGSREVACAAWSGVWCAPDMVTLIRRLLGI
jgi:predicted tellurium resistance membrane protein TerC